MSNNTVSSPAAAAVAYTPAAPPQPTPSPFSFSVASTRWSSRPPIQTANLLLRFLTLLLSSVSALSLGAVSPANPNSNEQATSFWNHPELLYCFTANVLAFLYAAYQLSKGICDVAHRGILISDKVSDYISFILDQLAGYLLVSASSVAIPAIQRIHNQNPLWKAAVVSVCMSFTSFLVIAANGLLSGYRLCKRIMW